MLQTPTFTTRDTNIAANGTHPLRSMFPYLIVCMLFIIASMFALTGCSNLGEFDQEAIVQQAVRYYESKYDAHVEVADVWEDRSYQLFGYRSSGRAFCTMEDGNTVLVDFEEGVLGDNRQQHEIVAAYEEQLREAIQDATQGLEDAGYTVSLVFINSRSPEADGFLEGQISTYTWQKNDDSPEESGSFFYARYSDSDRFFEQEAPHVSLGTPSIDIEISGRDAAYEHGFPMNVPARPSWVDPIDEACATLLPLTDNEPDVRVTVYQEGYRNYTRMEDEPVGVLGELSPFDNMEPTGNWLIVDWIPLGKGVYITSDEPGCACARRRDARGGRRRVFARGTRGKRQARRAREPQLPPGGVCNLSARDQGRPVRIGTGGRPGKRLVRREYRLRQHRSRGGS